MQKWQYVKCYMLEDDEDMIKTLNEYGKDEWELVSVLEKSVMVGSNEDYQSRYCFFFKRPI